MKNVSSFNHPHVYSNLYDFLFSKKKKNMFWRIVVTQTFWQALTSIIWRKEKKNTFSKYLLCSLEERNSYIFGATWWSVNYDQIFIFHPFEFLRDSDTSALKRVSATQECVFVLWSKSKEPHLQHKCQVKTFDIMAPAFWGWGGSSAPLPHCALFKRVCHECERASFPLLLSPGNGDVMTFADKRSSFTVCTV